MPAAAQLLLSALSKQLPEPSPFGDGLTSADAIPLTSEPPLFDATPLTSEPPLADATPLTSEPPLTVLAPLTSEPTAPGTAGGTESPGV
ncbi:hypothetical protein ACFVXE_15900 [Streptomyces sp. NPDC058231]|uniref:hypothetical protein n=1 Tax=unclassified Streptomyces TaxID=2593676 RepID=UPI0036E4FDF9